MADAYAIAVKITMQNGVSSVLRVVQNDVLGLSHNVDILQGKLTRMKVALAGAMAVGIGAGILDGLKGLAEAGGRVVDQMTNMQQAGMSNLQIAQATAAAYRDVAIAGTTISGNMSGYLTARSVMKNDVETIAALPSFLKNQFAFGTMGGDTGSFGMALKALDLQGGFVNKTTRQLDPALVNSSLNDYLTAYNLSHGLLTPQAIYQFTRLAGPAASMMSTSDYLRDNYEIMLGLGNSGGRGEQMAYKTFIGGQVSKALSERLLKYGIVGKGGITDDHGHYSITPGALQNTSTLLDPTQGIVGWFYKTILPDMTKAHMALTAGNLEKMLGPLDASTMKLFNFLLTNQAQVNAGQTKYDQASGVNHYDVATNSWSGALQNLSAAIGGKGGLWEALGTPLAQMAIPTLNKLTSGIRELTQWVGAHQGAVAIVEKIMLGLGVALTVLGTAAVVGALATMVGPAGGLVLLAGALTGLGVAALAVPGAIAAIDKDLQKFVYDILHPGTWVGSGSPGAPARRGPRALSQPYDGPGAIQTINDAQNAVLAGIKNWIDAGAPTNAHVTNTGDIARASSAVTIRNIRQGLTAPQTGSSTANYRLTPSGSAAATAR